MTVKFKVLVFLEGNTRMTIKLALRWLMWALLLALLSACGGGEESSNLLTDSGTTTDSDTPTDSGDTVETQSVVISVSGQRIVPTDDRTTLSIISFQTDSDGTASSAVQPNVTFSVNVTGNARLENVPDQTNNRGEAQFTVINPDRNTVLVTLEGTGVYEGAFSFPVYFGASVTSEVTNRDQFPIAPDNVGFATLLVIARDVSGLSIADETVYLSFPPGSGAVADPSSGTLDSQGQFTANITNGLIQETSVTPIVAGYVANTSTLSFDTSGGGTQSTISSIELLVSQNDVPANGTDFATVVVVPRDAGGQPIRNTSLRIASDSATAQMSIGDSTPETLFITGDTGDTGRFEINITNTVEETVSIYASVTIVDADGQTQILQTDPKSVVFANPTVDSGVAVSSITLESPIVNIDPDRPLLNDDQAPRANGRDTITIVGQVSDSENQPVQSGTRVSIVTTSSSATFSSTVTTDAAGFFTVVLTNTKAEKLSIRARVGSVSSDSQTVEFYAVSGVTDDPDITYNEPASIKLQLVNNRAVANNEDTITVVASVFDSDGTPMRDVLVTLFPNSSTALFDSGQKTTGDGGSVTFTVTSPQAQTFTLEAEASAQDDSGNAVGDPTERDSIEITFVEPFSDVTTLNVSVFNDAQVADGQQAIDINVVAVDNGGRRIANVPVSLQLATTEAVVANPAQGTTDENGLFSTQITSTVPESNIAVTVAVDGTSPVISKTVTISFIAAEGDSVTPANVDLTFVPEDDNTAPADGVTSIVLLVVPRDSNGTALSNVAVELVTDSFDISFQPSGTTGSTSVSGTTNSLGELRIMASSEVVNDNVSITAIAKGVRSETKTMVFVPTSIDIPATASIAISTSDNTKEVGESIDLTVLVLDTDTGQPLTDKEVVLSIEGSTSVVFEAPNGFSGLTDSTTGVFSTSVTSLQAGEVTVRATIKGTTISSTLDLKFEQPSTAAPEIESIELITTNTQLASEGDSEGVTITAIVKNLQNNLVENATVTFRSTGENDSNGGEVTPIVCPNSAATVAGVTDVSGRACARLTTQGSPDNRTITVLADVINAEGNTLSDDINIEVVGTTLTISGSEAIPIGETATFTISLRDSANTGIANTTLLIESALGNILNDSAANITANTNANGQIEVTVLATNAGEETITVSKSGVTKITSAVAYLSISDQTLTATAIPSTSRSELCPLNEDTNNNSKLDAGEDLNGNNLLDTSGCEIPLNETQQFTVTWLSGGSNVTKPIQVTTTRGIVDPTVLRVLAGDTTFPALNLSSDNAGTATITLKGESGPSFDFDVIFFATTASRVDVQAAQAVLSSNVTGDDSQRTEITAIVRDAKGNLVKNKQVNFNLSDFSGGRLTRSTAITNASGQATTEYIAGINTSASDGVRITAEAVDTSGTAEASGDIFLTVAQRSVFISVGSGNTIFKEEDGRIYSLPFSALVTDSNGTPVSDAQVILTVRPSAYVKNTTPETVCANEDENFDGLLDPTEDFNSNGKLDPGGVVTVSSDSGSFSITTDATGFALFNVVYAIQYANWVEVDIIARVAVSGSENVAVTPFRTTCSAPDFEDEICPQQSPFGTTTDCSTAQ